MLTLIRLLVYWAYIHGLIPAALLVADAAQNSSDDTPSWHQYVRAPASRTVLPKDVLSEYTAGNVTNAKALVSGKGDTAYLTRDSEADDVPTVVIDFGQNVVGLLEIDFAGSTSYSGQGRPGLKLSFSETLQFLTNRSDFTRSDNADGVC